MATRTGFDEVISEFRRAASTAEAGTRFEELIIDYFYADPTLSVVYDEVHPWSRWSHNENSHDVGIDLVARNRELGTWTAIQCKFYDQARQLQKKDIDSFFTASGRRWDGVAFDNRIIISTTDKWSSHAEQALAEQLIPVQRIGLTEMSAAPIDWMRTSDVALDFEARQATRYRLRAHQKEAIEKIQAGLAEHDRGQWISACGTGKTFTSLRLAEQRCADNGGQLKVLFLAPSISLVSQTLREWMAQSQTTIRPLVVCSDTKATKAAEDISTHDIPLPTTSPERLLESMSSIARRGKQMTVVFSTYQSIEVVASAMREAGESFDLILCDEAHRTTGVRLAGETDESAFVKVHDNDFLPATKRLYMTATPRIYGEAVRNKANEVSAVLTSMDDESIFGPVFHSFGFGEAVEKGLLSDYKVMILCVTNESVAAGLHAAGAADGTEVSLDDAAKIIGCWNGLAKRTKDMDFGEAPVPMKRAVAFADSIKSSTRFAEVFPDVVDQVMGDEGASALTVAAHHVDGSMNAMIRGEELAWLKAPVPDNECRILSNARCLSEGVDVPALDAVLFLSPRNSLVDVVQSVGRVMRKAPGKEFGYIILPVAIDADQSPEEALKNNKRFKVVWDVLNALRSHDDRFNAMVNSIDLDKNTKGKVAIDVFPTSSGGERDADSPSSALQIPLFGAQVWKDAILARIVKKVGDREYWDAWADDVVSIHHNQVSRITSILGRADATLSEQFDAFLTGLRANINESITAPQAIDMISQHLITEPIFTALFSNGDFAHANPVSASMDQMVAALDGFGLNAETEALAGFYASVQRTVAQVTSAAGRQTIIHRLYEEFFTKAFKKQSESLGVVYTPVEVVDFILRMADAVSREAFGQSLSDPGVNILDPFTGTGTFVVRLLESGIISAADLERKFDHELWANEIMLLAYYIACVNVETTYQSLRSATLPEGELAEYRSFPGATFTDTFQISETSDRVDTSLIPANSDRISTQLATPIQVIVGNPPYSAGQNSANDDNANLAYPTLDARIADTYAARSTATNKNSLYDSYVRALRWASDRITDRGIVAFVTNNGWVDGNTADGIRLSMAEEFSDIWVYNLRGNQRTAGETSKREGGQTFGSGARTGIAVVVAAKTPPRSDSARIHYYQVDDYLTREQKLDGLTRATLTSVPWRTITPNEAGDWVTQRDEAFLAFPVIGSKKGEQEGIFALHSNGIKTNRDAWCYNFSTVQVTENMSTMVHEYNRQAETVRGDETLINRDSTRISWSRGLLSDALRGRHHTFKPERVYTSVYRPFTKQNAYFDRPLNDMVYRMERVFPTPSHQNVGFVIMESGSRSGFCTLAMDSLPDSKMFTDAAPFFPRWTYTPADDTLLGAASEDGYVRQDNITPEILAEYRSRYGQVSGDDVFAYVYAVLHSPQYRTRFAGDLKRMLPRIPWCRPEDFRTFVEAGNRLLELHIGYENVEPYPLHEQLPLGIGTDELYRVEKMKWADKTTRRDLVVNQYITLRDVPAVAHTYMLGSRSALDWVIDRYQMRVDKASGIVNDPNDWGREHGDPRYIVDLIKRVTRVSVDTMAIVDALPELPLDQS